jgi:hypothetical protein
MSKKKQTQEILPWNNGELETLLKGIISHGTEIAKVDFKTEVQTGTNEQKADLLKDIIAIANTYDTNYNDHGFIIYGVKAKAVTGITQTEPDTDKFQNHIEQLLKTYISPMPQIYVLGFEDVGKKWGAIVIPPRNSKPHMFFKELFCTDRSRSRKKGEWFVRRGSTTDPGLPEDLAIINQKQTELLLEPLKESIRTLQSRVAKTEDQYNSALFKLVERAVSTIPGNVEREVETPADLEINVRDAIDVGESLGMDLPTRIKQKLRTPKNAIAEDLIAEAKNLREYLDSANSGLPWAPQLQNPEGNKKIISDLEDRIQALQLSMATIMLSDSKGEYTDALLRALKILAKATDVPSGTQYNRIGESLRYYPIMLLLYTIFICGVVANRGNVLKQVLEIPIKHRQRNETSPITDAYFFSSEAKSLINDAYAQRWCEPIAQRVRQVIGDKIGEMITEFSEPEYFFRAEFVMALTNIDKGISQKVDVERRTPLGGLYLYMHEAQGPIIDFIAENPEWFVKLYVNPLNEILDMFDRNADKMAGSGCFAIGMHNIKTSQAYQEAVKKTLKP